MNKDQNFDVAFTARQFIDSHNVLLEELRLISVVFPEILKEMIQHIEQD